MVDFGLRDESVFLKDPVDLLFFAPHDMPLLVVSFDLFPLSFEEGFVDAVSEGCFEFDVLARLVKKVRGSRVVLFFYVFAEVFRHKIIIIK